MAYVAGACLAVLVILSAYNVSVLTVEHVLTAIIVLGAIVAGSRWRVKWYFVMLYSVGLWRLVIAGRLLWTLQLEDRCSVFLQNAVPI
jgi:hypothetical protein